MWLPGLWVNADFYQMTNLFRGKHAAGDALAEDGSLPRNPAMAVVISKLDAGTRHNVS